MEFLILMVFLLTSGSLQAMECRDDFKKADLSNSREVLPISEDSKQTKNPYDKSAFVYSDPSKRRKRKLKSPGSKNKTKPENQIPDRLSLLRQAEYQLPKELRENEDPSFYSFTELPGETHNLDKDNYFQFVGYYMVTEEEKFYCSFSGEPLWAIDIRQQDGSLSLVFGCDFKKLTEEILPSKAWTSLRVHLIDFDPERHCPILIEDLKTRFPSIVNIIKVV